MGALLSLRSNSGVDPAANVFLDFESMFMCMLVGDLQKQFLDCKPSEAEVSTHEKVLQSLKPSASILAKLKAYSGCSEFIRKVISIPIQNTE